MKAPTLADLVYRETFRRDSLIDPRRRADTLSTQRRFVLDASMSEFLVPLGNEAFLARPERRLDLLESLRRSAKPPHALTWIEYDAHARRRAAQKGNPLLVDPEQIAPRAGWAIAETEPGIVQASVIVELDGRPHPLPWEWLWLTDDSLDEYAAWGKDKARDMVSLGDKDQPDDAAAVATGIPDYQTHRVKVVSNFLVAHPEREQVFLDLLQEWRGELRTIWALLSTINDIPTTSTVVRQDRGFVARGRYRKFLDHTTVHLRVPGKKTVEQVARAVVASARRRHEVRGHWRVFTWGAELPCPREGHIWRGDNSCGCGSRRTWVAEHERGDARLGFVTHDYAVTHKDPPGTQDNT